MDESLMPPSAFIQTINSSNNILGFDGLFATNYPLNNFTNFANNFTQTDNAKLVNKASLTTDTVITESEMMERITKKKYKYLEKIDKLKSHHNQNKMEMNQVIDNLNKQISDINKEKFSYQEELDKMKFYISGIESRETWLQEKQRLIREIEKLNINEREQLSIISSLKIQLSNMEKIQSIQEKELENDIVKRSSHRLSPHELKFETLLRVWRHKVLSLMVQHESQEICFNKEKHQLKNEVLEHKNEIEHLCNILETMNLKLKSNEAQFSSDEIIMEKLKRENDYLFKEVEHISEEKLEYQFNIDVIFNKIMQFHSQMEKYMENKLQKASSKLEVLQRRLDYANSRFPMIEANVTRNNNLAIRSETNNRLELDIPRESMEFKIREMEEALLVTHKEIQQLRTERNQLISTVERDSSTFNDRINEKRRELEEEMTKLQSTVTHLEKTLHKTHRELEILKNENSRLKSNFDELLTDKHNESENLQIALSESQTNFSTLSLEFSEFKRSSLAQKNKLEEKIQLYDQKLKERESFWIQHCDDLKAECNLLKMTIRQEGILSNLKTRSQSDKQNESNKLPTRKSEIDSVMKEVENLTNELQIDVGDCK